MMSKSITSVCCLLVLVGCGSSPPTHFYTLNSTALSMGTKPADYTVAIDPVTIPATDDRPQMVVQTGPNQVQVDEFNQWAAPLGANIASVVAGDLSTELGTPHVVLAPPTPVQPAYRVTINVQRFKAIPGDYVLVDAVWVVRGSSGKLLQSGRTLAKEPVHGQGYEVLAAGFSRALARVSGDIATAISAEPAAGD